jgi:hypothetical protein
MAKKLSKHLSQIQVNSFVYKDDKDMWFLIKKQSRQLEEKSRLKVFIDKNQKNKQLELFIVGSQPDEQVITKLKSLQVIKEEIPISDPKAFHKLYSDIVLEKKVAEYQQKWNVGIYLDPAKQTSIQLFDFVLLLVIPFG